MKFSTVMMCLVCAVCVAGCKYSKSGKGGAGAGAGDDISGAKNIATESDANGANSADGADEGDLASLSDRPFDTYCERCTDVNFDPVYFGFDATVVPQGELGKVDAVVQHLTEKADRVVIIEGNCDERGSNEYNMSLGENRAGVLRGYLVQGGIATDRIQTRSYGEEKPAVQGADESAWSKNRRGEFAIFQKK